MTPKMNFQLADAVAALTGDAGNAEMYLEDAFNWAETPQGDMFWQREYERLEEGEDLTEAAATAIKNWIAEALGFTPAGVAVQSVVAGLTPSDAAGDGGAATIEQAKADPFPARAVAFGQPQYMGGMGAWDNLRYFDTDQD